MIQSQFEDPIQSLVDREVERKRDGEIEVEEKGSDHPS
jgi:hypothetical protein